MKEEENTFAEKDLALLFCKRFLRVFLKSVGRIVKLDFLFAFLKIRKIPAFFEWFRSIFDKIDFVRQKSMFCWTEYRLEKAIRTTRLPELKKCTALRHSRELKMNNWIFFRSFKKNISFLFSLKSYDYTIKWHNYTQKLRYRLFWQNYCLIFCITCRKAVYFSLYFLLSRNGIIMSQSVGRALSLT